MAKYNASAGKLLAKRIARQASDNTLKSAMSQKTIRLLYDAVHNFNNSQQEKSMRYLVSRFIMDGENFAKIVNLAPIHELIIGIKLGIYKTAEDIDNNTAFGRRINKGSDLTLNNSYNQEVGIQVKGEHGYIKIGPSAKIVLKPNGILDREASLPSILDEYFRSGPDRMTFPMTYGGHSANAFFDLGMETFKRMAERYPTWFNPTLEKKYMQIKTEDFNRESLKILKENNLDAKGFQSLQVVAGSKLTAEQKTLLEMIRKVLLIQREAEWRKYGRIYIRMNPKNQLTLATDPYLSPLINTGIRRYENHAPFYAIIDQIFGSGNIRTYLEANSATAGNKSPKFYYNNIYHDINY